MPPDASVLKRNARVVLEMKPRIRATEAVELVDLGPVPGFWIWTHPTWRVMRWVGLGLRCQMLLWVGVSLSTM